MRKLINHKTTAAALAATVVVCLLSGCKGRTLKDVEPNGETIEVVVGAENEANPTPAAETATETANDTITNI